MAAQVLQAGTVSATKRAKGLAGRTKQRLGTCHVTGASHTSRTSEARRSSDASLIVKGASRNGMNPTTSSGRSTLAPLGPAHNTVPTTWAPASSAAHGAACACLRSLAATTTRCRKITDVQQGTRAAACMVRWLECMALRDPGMIAYIILFYDLRTARRLYCWQEVRTT
jgi:hypothetical protein